ncbi:MAG: universal stress protein [Nitrospiraceae bacterium]
MLHRILFATDFSQGARHAQAYAAFLAHAYSAELTIIHVFEIYPSALYADPWSNPLLLEPLRDEISRNLDELAANVRRCGVQATNAHVIGIASEQLIETARNEAVDLIIVGTQGRTGLEHVLLGSTAERVVKGAPCPVMTVRSSGPAPSHDTPITIKRIVAPTDFSDCSLDALEYTIQMAKRFEASVTIVHVLEWASVGLDFSVAEVAEGGKVRKETERRIAELADVIRTQGLTAESVIRGGGAPADFVLELARERGADLIVMGTHGRRGLSRLLAGSVAEGVLRRSPCPVITVKSPKFSPGHRRVLNAAGRA